MNLATCSKPLAQGKQGSREVDKQGSREVDGEKELIDMKEADKRKAERLRHFCRYNRYNAMKSRVMRKPAKA